MNELRRSPLQEVDPQHMHLHLWQHSADLHVFGMWLFIYVCKHMWLTKAPGTAVPESAVGAGDAGPSACATAAWSLLILSIFASQHHT